MSSQLEASESGIHEQRDAVMGVPLQLVKDLTWPQQTVIDAVGNASGLQLSTSSGGQVGGPTVITSSLTIQGPLNPAGGLKMLNVAQAPKGANLQNVQVDTITGILYWG